MRTDRRLRAIETLSAHGWEMYCHKDGKLTAARAGEGGDWTLEGVSDSGELLFFRLPGETDRQVRVGLYGGLRWMYQDRGGRWRSRPVRGGEEVGIDETLDALRAFDAREQERRDRAHNSEDDR